MSFQLKNASNMYKTYYEKDKLVFKSKQSIGSYQERKILMIVRIRGKHS